MTEDDLKRLQHLPVPAPREGAKEAALAAALAAFKAVAPAHAGAPQGSTVPPRLRDTSSSEGSSRMRFRRPAAIAASIAVLVVAVPFTLYLVQAPTVPERGGPQGLSRQQEQPWDRADLSKPAPAESPAPPPPTSQIAARPSHVD